VLRLLVGSAADETHDAGRDLDLLFDVAGSPVMVTIWSRAPWASARIRLFFPPAEGICPARNLLSVVESLHDGHDEAALQRQQLGAVQTRQFIEHFFAILQQVNLDAPPILGGTAAFDKTLFFAARNQRDNAMMLRLQTLREFSNRSPVATGIAFDMQQ
jgi:hypothetical protein